jgi:glycine/D-amino acid oxidase-like deaminating enzyme
MAKLHLGNSYWIDQHGGTPRTHAPLRGMQYADIAVVGAGITGCLAAHGCAAAGLSVIMLEAGRVGRGSTAASTALLMQEPDVDFRDLSERYGAERAREIWRLSARSVRGLVDLIRRLRIAAALGDVPSVYWSGDPARALDLHRELRERHRAGIRGRWMTPAMLKREIGVDGAGGILTRGNAQIDPYRACLGLAARLSNAGVRIHERSPVRRVSGSATGVHITLDQGEVRAAWAVIATGYATPEFKPLAGKFRMSTTYVIATAPLSLSRRRVMGPGTMWWDTETPYHYARWSPDHRLVFGGRDIPRRSGRTRSKAFSTQTKQLQSDLVSLYASLETVPIEYAWEGLFATTRDGLPYIGTHRRYPRQLFALGYGGNGMTFGYLAAEVLVRRVTGRPTEVDQFFSFGRVR